MECKLEEWRRVTRGARPTGLRGWFLILAASLRRPLPSYAVLLLVLLAGASGLWMGRATQPHPLSSRPEELYPAPSAPSVPTGTVPGESSSFADASPHRPWAPGFVAVQSDATRLDVSSTPDSL